ncbi:hypothetical protein VP1G_08699 [Cytospora mali]|uniref:DUF7730 domain-containing protein n=1 Tax=Cytospora mali TaxID=578113 RepID=A0A194VCA0_CYTMA|nr:hypothetical protein VP1G_08699 [Valsa mali var. pyri (nom. inval.)]
MLEEEVSPFLLLSAEIRLQIYAYLLDDGGNQWLAIRNHPDSRYKDEAIQKRSTRYHVMERNSIFNRRGYETTYHLASSHAHFHTAIMSTCRLVYHETAHILYGTHNFDFGHDIEAVVPFLQDRTPYTRSLAAGISIYKRAPLPCLDCTREKYEWAFLCRYLAETRTLKRLRLIVEGGRPGKPWEGVQTLTESDFRLLSLIRHDRLEWVTELSQVKGVTELDVVSDMRYLPVPKSPETALYAAVSASVETGLKNFLWSEMGTVT